MNRKMAAPLIMLLVLLHMQLIFQPLELPFPFFSLLLILTALWMKICAHVRLKLTIALLFILIAMALIFLPLTLDALRVFYNMLLETYRLHSPLYFMSLDTHSLQGNEQLLLWSVMLGLFIFGTLLLHWLIGLKNHFCLAFLLLASFLLPCVLHSVPQPVTALPLLFILIAMLFARAQSLGAIFRSKLRICFMLAGCIIPIALCLILIPPAEISGSGEGVRQQLLTSLTNFIEWVTGRNDDTEIDLNDAQDRMYIGSTRGRVLATVPDTYYLKDTSMAIYEDNTWQAITETEYDEQLGAQYDYSRVATIISEYPLDTVYADGTIMDLPMLTIQDMRGNDAHQLIPYYLSGIRDMDEMTFVQDRFVRPGQSDSVTFDLLSDQQDYLDPENYRDVAATHDVPLPSYDRFVRRFYTQLPEATEAFFDRQPDLPDPITIRTYSTAQAVSLIREFLWDNAEYTLTPGALPADTDFVEYFLSDNHQGYCVHYATAATLLLRYYGYPARYVEGFRVGQEAFSGGIASIRDYNEHAWVELYDPYLGWLPLEFTESSFDFSEYGAAAGTGEQEDTPDEPLSEPDTPADSPVDQPAVLDRTDEQRLALPMTELAAAAAAVLLILQPLPRRAWKKSRLRQKDHQKAVLYGYHQLQKMARYGLPIPQEARALAQKARFSRHHADAADARAMAELLMKTRKKRRQLSLWKRFLFIYRDAL